MYVKNVNKTVCQLGHGTHGGKTSHVSFSLFSRGIFYFLFLVFLVL